jgi:uncharacterized protein (TIGR02452 family)
MEIFQKRIDCYKHTITLAKQKYPISKPSIKYIYDPKFTFTKKYNTIIKVIDNDTIDTAIQIICKNYKPLVLNLADDVIPGGCVETGSGAQEESLFRRSNYFLSLQYDRKYYPILHNEAIYSPEITVFKSNEKMGWKLFDNPITMDFIACPGLKYPRVITQIDDNGKSVKRLEDYNIEILKNKIRLIFQIGYKNNHNVLVLGALGCGAWRSPPEHVAEIFQEICKEYNGMFKFIIFAVLKGAGDNVRASTTIDNYDIFTKYFS